MTAAGTRPHLTDKKLGDLLSLVRGADTVELKLTVPESDQRSAVEALAMDPIDAQIRQVYFFDTPDLALNDKGVVVRARRVQGKGDDTVVKLRPVVPAELSKKLRRTPGFGVEVDAMPGGYVDDLSILGPIFVLKLKFSPKGFSRKLVAEMWLYPDESRILELSTKCAPAETFESAAETRAFLAEAGVDLSGEQQTKTRRALEFFSARIAAGAGPVPTTVRSR